MKWSVFLFCLILVAVLFVVGLLMNPPFFLNRSYFPPEGPALSAKRTEAGNGYFLIEEAIEISRRMELSLRNTFFDLVQNGFPEVPLNAEQVKMADPAIKALNRALDAEYYLFPEIGEYGDSNRSFRHGCDELAALLGLIGHYHHEREEFSAELDYYLTICRFGKTLMSDGAYLQWWSGRRKFLLGLSLLQRSISDQNDGDSITRTIEALKELKSENRDSLRKTYQFELRLIENTEPSSFYETGPNDSLNRFASIPGLRNLWARINFVRFQLGKEKAYSQVLETANITIEDPTSIRAADALIQQARRNDPLMWVILGSIEDGPREQAELFEQITETINALEARLEKIR